MKILILGGTGAMGSPLTKILAEMDNEIFITTRSDREPLCGNVHYLKGNAHENEFLERLLIETWDAIIDFMVNSTDEFKNRYESLLSKTKQYVFISSARVYEFSEVPLTENSSRLLDVTQDEIYLMQKEYALEKALQENLLMQSSAKNWTIIRPYITYNDERLQLGVLEKEGWLYRALQGKSIVFSKDIAEKYTTLTYGDDVAKKIAQIIGLDLAYGEVFHVTTNRYIKWKDVLNIYLDAVEVETGTRPKVYWVENALYMEYIMGNIYQIKYDRLYNRIFDNDKISNILMSESESTEIKKIEYVSPQEGLFKCVTTFIKSEYKFKDIAWRLEGYHDRLTKERTNISVISKRKWKVVYCIYRYAPLCVLKILKLLNI